MEKQNGYKLKVLRTDHGGELILAEFQDFCMSHGIKKKLTVRYTPEYNGVAERGNKSMVEMARSMLEGRNVPNKCWAEAVHITVYLNKGSLDKTPYESMAQKEGKC